MGVVKVESANLKEIEKQFSFVLIEKVKKIKKHNLVIGDEGYIKWEDLFYSCHKFLSCIENFEKAFRTTSGKTRDKYFLRAIFDFRQSIFEKKIVNDDMFYFLIVKSFLEITADKEMIDILKILSNNLLVLSFNCK